MKPFKVVDLFAGPGGLAEGFSAYRHNGRRAFDISLSIEKEASAFATLRLRSFFRQFGNKVPESYYRFVDGAITQEELVARFPEQWKAACDEALQLELGTPEAQRKIDPRLDTIRKEADGGTILIGGPPCQAYSLVGRARNSGNADYVAGEDARHFLYREYIRIIGKLKPVAFVMENVKGFLSASVDGVGIFQRVLADLKSAGGTPDSYRIIPLTSTSNRRGQEHVIEAERFGVPQRRHRVILFGVRKDVATGAAGLALAGQSIEPAARTTTVRDVLEGMPRLRSALSKDKDSPSSWRQVVVESLRRAAAAAFDEEGDELDAVVEQLERYAGKLEKLRELPGLSSTALAPVKDPELATWLLDPRLRTLPNHASRSHMKSDLARYAFSAVFGAVNGRSPKARDYPSDLAPDHQNWASGKFADRFRVQLWDEPSTTVTSHISKDGHYFIHPDPLQCRSLTVREAARLQTFPDNYVFLGNRTEQYVQVGNAVPPYLARQVAGAVHALLRSAGSA